MKKMSQVPQILDKIQYNIIRERQCPLLSAIKEGKKSEGKKAQQIHVIIWKGLKPNVIDTMLQLKGGHKQCTTVLFLLSGRARL